MWDREVYFIFIHMRKKWARDKSPDKTVATNKFHTVKQKLLEATRQRLFIAEAMV